jgi:hypothetical protein
VLDHLGRIDEVERAVGEGERDGLRCGDREPVPGGGHRDGPVGQVDAPHLGAASLADRAHEEAFGAADVER